MFTFALALAIGMLFSSMLSSIFIFSPLANILFWTILIVITILTLTVSFVDAHISTVRFMNEFERKKHSKYVGLWMFSLVLGALVFILPAIFSQDYSIEPIVLLFSFGGILWILYASVRALFKHSYFEIAYAASVLWIIFVIGIAAVGSSNTPLNAAQGIAVLFVAMATLIVVFGSLGITMMFKSTKEFVVDFENFVRTIDGEPLKRVPSDEEHIRRRPLAASRKSAKSKSANKRAKRKAKR